MVSPVVGEPVGCKVWYTVDSVPVLFVLQLDFVGEALADDAQFSQPPAPASVSFLPEV